MPIARPRSCALLLSLITANMVGSISTYAQASTVPSAMINPSDRSAGYSAAHPPLTANDATISQRRLDRSAKRPPGRARISRGTANRLMVMPMTRLLLPRAER